MSAATALARGRVAAEALMVDACTIVRKSSESASGGMVSVTTTPVYSGKCRIQVKQEPGGGRTVGEAYLIVQRLELQLPITAAELAEGDLVTMTASALDPQLVGKTYAVRDVAPQDAPDRAPGHRAGGDVVRVEQHGWPSWPPTSSVPARTSPTQVAKVTGKACNNMKTRRAEQGSAATRTCRTWRARSPTT
jgi:hypothetical protein